MKNLLTAVLLFSTAAAAAEEIKTPGTAAAESAAAGPAAAKPASLPDGAPEQIGLPLKYSAEIRRTIKHLSILLERGGELPPAGTEAFAAELEKFDAKLTDTLGPEIMAAVARREKRLENEQRALAARKDLQAVRTALQVYYGDNNAVYPKDLSALVPNYIPAIPELYLPDHERTSAAKIVDSKKYDKDFAKAVTDGGGWLYFSDKGSLNYGLLILDCSHSDNGGPEFFKY